MAKSNYYFELNRVDAVFVKNSDLLPGLKIFFHENKGRNGVVRIHQEFFRIVHVVNHKRVQQLRHLNNLFRKLPKEKYYSNSSMLETLLIILLTTIFWPKTLLKIGVQMYLYLLFLEGDISYLES